MYARASDDFTCDALLVVLAKTDPSERDREGIARKAKIEEKVESVDFRTNEAGIAGQYALRRYCRVQRM